MVTQQIYTHFDVEKQIGTNKIHTLQVYVGL